MIREAADLHPFDLQGRMKLAVNARTTCVDPNLGYISYSQIHFDTDPPHMVHTVGDFVDDMGRHTDSLWLNRSATDDHINDEVVRRLVQNTMDDVAEGLPWDPPQMPFVWGEKKEDWPKERWGTFTRSNPSHSGNGDLSSRDRRQASVGCSAIGGASLL